MRICRIVAIVIAIITLLPMSNVADAAPGGNSTAARACQEGGYTNYTRADGTTFRNVGQCVSYAAQGGELVEVDRGEVLDQFSVGEGGPAESVGGGYFVSADRHVAQTFTAGLTGTLTRVYLYLRIDDGDPGDLVVEIRTVDDDGVPTEEILGTATVPSTMIPSLGNEWGEVLISFSPSVEVVAGTTYALVATSTQGSGRYLWAIVPDSNPGGNPWLRRLSPDWEADTVYDLTFRTYVD